MKKILFFFLPFIFIFSCFASYLEEQFKNNNFLYNVFFNKIYVGKINWLYLGEQEVEGKEAEVLFIESDAKILRLLNLESKEKIFLEKQSFLPLKVEREVIFFGKKEVIFELYFQEEGKVKIIKVNSKKEENIIEQNKPIYHIFSLLYFFPKSIKIEKNKNYKFYLPTREIEVRLIKETSFFYGGEKKDVYLLSGKGDYHFYLWLDKKTRSPLQLEFITPLGKVTIRKR